MYYPWRAYGRYGSGQTNLSLPSEKEHSKKQKEPLEIKNLTIKISTERSQEKVELEDKKKR